MWDVIYDTLKIINDGYYYITHAQNSNFSISLSGEGPDLGISWP